MTAVLDWNAVFPIFIDKWYYDLASGPSKSLLLRESGVMSGLSVQALNLSKCYENNETNSWLESATQWLLYCELNTPFYPTTLGLYND